LENVNPPVPKAQAKRKEPTCTTPSRGWQGRERTRIKEKRVRIMAACFIKHPVGGFLKGYLMSQHLLIVGQNASLRQALCEQFELDGTWRLSESALPVNMKQEDNDVRMIIAYAPTAETLNELLSRFPDSSLMALMPHGLTIEHEDVDIISLPAHISTLLGAVRARLKRQDRQEEKSLALGPYIFHPDTRILEASGGRKIRLTEKECAMLLYLLNAQGGAVSRDELLQEVWGYNSNVTTHTLETHIYRLRQKIEPDATTAQILVTDSSGYRLIS
jgi:hypothetical protein